MGVYYKLVNITKREQFEPPNIKSDGFKAAAEQIVCLLLHGWSGDEVRLVHDSEDGGWWDKVATLDETSKAWPNRCIPEWKSEEDSF